MNFDFNIRMFNPQPEPPPELGYMSSPSDYWTPPTEEVAFAAQAAR